MSRASDEDLLHWAVAAYCFSLDLAEGLAAYAVPDARPDVIRSAARGAILDNREHVTQHGAPLYLREAMAARWHGTAAELSAFESYVEGVFISPRRQAALHLPSLRLLRQPEQLADLDGGLAAADGGPGYAARVYSAVPSEIAVVLFDLVTIADAVVDAGELSGWDAEIIARNSEMHSPDSPLALLIHSEMNRLEAHAATLMRDACGPEANAVIDAACAAVA
ncbi:MAG: hypothetical protein AAGA15_11865 [Pseudomonadota bacterium]